MSEVTPDPKAIFFEALEQETPQDLAEFLDGRCGQDSQLRWRVEELLRAHQKAGNFLGGTSELDETVDLPRDPTTGTQIGPYKLLQRIGEGGMGEVYMAEQTMPVERRVAVKIIKPGMDSRHVIARFEAERQALAIMDHPNIARIFDAGAMEDGRPFFVMELVKGVPLLEYCDEHQLDVRKRLELFQAVCHAVQHAHHKGIIHRDLKPSNVLVAEYDDDVVPKIIDFGVAKATQRRLTDKTMFTEIGTVVGTIEYMSPEQAKLNQLDIDTRSDIYSLGALLYELLIGEAPFDRGKLRSAALDEMLRIIREEEPSRPSIKLSHSQSLPSIAANRHVEPRKLNMLVRGELDWIVMKALEKERSRRYQTASAFAADIANYLSDNPVAACPPSATYRFRKFVRHNKSAITTSLAIAALLVVGLATTTWLWRRTVQALVTAERQREIAVAAEQLAEEQLYRSRVNLAYVALNSGDGNSFQELMSQISSPRNHMYSRGIELKYLLARKKAIESAALLDAPSTVLELSYSRKGELVASCSDGSCYIANTKSKNPILRPITIDEGVATFSSQANYLLTNPHFDGLESITQDKCRIRTYPALEPVESAWVLDGTDLISLGPDEKRVVIRRANGELEIRDLADGKLLLSPLRHVDGYVLSPKGRKLVVERGRELALFDLNTGQQLHEVRQSVSLGGWQGPSGLRFSADGDYLARYGHHGARLWNISEDGMVRADWQLDTETYSIAFSQDGFLAAGCSDQTVKIWHLDDLGLQLANLIHPSTVTAVAFTHDVDGGQLSVGCRGGSLRVWDSNNWNRPRVVGAAEHIHPPFDVSADCVAAIASLTSNHALHLVSLRTGKERVVLKTSGAKVVCAAFSPDGRYVACGDAGGYVSIWDRSTDAEEPAAEYHQLESVRSLTFSRDNRLAAGGNGRVTIWLDPEDPACIFFKAPLFVGALRFAPSGRLAIGGGRTPSVGGTVTIIDLDSNEVLRKLPTAECVRDLDFSADKHLIAFTESFSAGLVRILDTRTWEDVECSPLSCHPGKSTQLAFAGNRLITGSDNGALRIWDFEHGEVLGTLDFDGKVRGMSVLPSGSEFATISRKGVVCLWGSLPE